MRHRFIAGDEEGGRRMDEVEMEINERLLHEWCIFCAIGMGELRSIIYASAKV